MTSIKKIHQNPRYFTFLSGLYVALVLLIMIVENKVILISSIHVVTGTMIIPFVYVLSDIITEVYGYKEMKKLIWSSIFILNIISILIFFIMKLPSPLEETTLNGAYTMIFGPFTRDITAYSLASFGGVFLNSYLLSKWKILTQGRFFWLRSLGSSAIGEFVFVLLFGFLAFYRVFSLGELSQILIFSYLYKIVCNIILIGPSSLVVSSLKNREQINTFDLKVSFNPFN